MKIYVASVEDVVNGLTTDIYFKRTREILVKKGLHRKVRMEFHVHKLPRGYDWAVFTGLEEVLYILKGKPVTVYSLPEGTLFKEKEPLLIIEGYYDDFAVYETPILGVLRHYTSISTKSARVKKLARGRTVLFFGLRATHPAIHPMVDRAAYIGGVDAVSGVASEKYLGLKPVGTMPHALILVFKNQIDAWRSFDEVVEPDVPRVMLVDTFFDERVESMMAANIFGDKLYGVRLDTPSSRRGDMKSIVEEVRWTLDIHGFKHVKIIVSGGLDEEEIVELRDLVDAFGVGTAIALPPSVDISADIVEVFDEGEWRFVTKRGKLPGAKQLYRRRPGLNDYVGLLERSSPPSGEHKPMLTKYMENGVVLTDLPSVDEIRRYVLEQLEEVAEPKPL